MELPDTVVAKLVAQNADIQHLFNEAFGHIGQLYERVEKLEGKKEEADDTVGLTKEEY